MSRMLPKIFLVVISLLTRVEAMAETADKSTEEIVASSQLKFELHKAIDRQHAKNNVIQEKEYSPIIFKYINKNTTLSDAVKILRGAGFSITVLGDGFFEPYPASGLPIRGTLVSATLSYKQGFLSGNVLGVHMFLNNEDYITIKEVKVSVGTVAP